LVAFLHVSATRLATRGLCSGAVDTEKARRGGALALANASLKTCEAVILQEPGIADYGVFFFCPRFGREGLLGHG